MDNEGIGAPSGVEGIVQSLLEQGMAPERAAEALKVMAEEGKMAPEDLEKGLALLQKAAGAAEDEGAEKAEASRLLGAAIA